MVGPQACHRWPRSVDVAAPAAARARPRRAARSRPSPARADGCRRAFPGVYALLGLVRRFGAARVEAVCAEALAVELFDVRRLRRIEHATRPERVRSDVPVPPARFLRPTAQYALRPRDAEAPAGGAA